MLNSSCSRERLSLPRTQKEIGSQGGALFNSKKTPSHRQVPQLIELYAFLHLSATSCGVRVVPPAILVAICVCSPPHAA